MEFRLADALPVLESTPPALRALLAPLPAAWTSAPEPGGGWTVEGVLGHLNHGEDTDWIPRARIILSRPADPRFEPYDRFRHWTRNVDRSLPSLLSEFATLRRANLAQLDSWRLTEEHFGLTGIHPMFGPVTLRQLLAAWVVHDLGHIAQVARVMAKQYRETVGPWVPFMPVLTDHETPRS